jgi:dynein heavy chain
VTHNAIEQFISNTHGEWYSSVDASLSRHLQANLLQQDKGTGERAG